MSYAAAPARYYVPHHAHWPIAGSIGLFTLLGGAGLLLTGHDIGRWSMLAGAAIFITMLFGWFGEVIRESRGGLYNTQVDTSYRLGMIWFIFSEVMFFAAFFGALFYARTFVVLWLGGQGSGALTNELLWPGFEAVWPSNGPAGVGGPFETIPADDVPLLNTFLLFSSSFTIMMAHKALKKGTRRALALWMAATITLGALFLYYQASEYIHAYHELGLTLGSGIYGSTFFMLTGFHGMHVTLGAIMLTVILLRILAGHFTAKNHFAFEAVAWYWHFVDVVWLGLFFFVYVL